MKLAQIDTAGKITGILTLQNYIDILDHILVPDEAQVGYIYDAKTESVKPDPADAIKRQIAVIDNQILELENKTYRPLREIALGLDSDGKAQTKLSELNSQITELRTQRTTLEAQLN